jgi:ABC-type transport system involved in multi-copper enzyme maturation permease subunit
MNTTLMSAFWRERFTSPVRLLLLFTFVGFTLIGSLLRRPAQLPGDDSSFWLVLVLGGGVIGRDLSTGTLQLILARPVGRSEYVLSRWLGLATASFALAFLGWAIALPFSLSGGGTTVADSLGVLAEHFFVTFGLAAVLTGFSALLPGFGDLALLLFGGIVSLGMMTVAGLVHIPWIGRLGSELMKTLFPTVAIHELSQGGTLHLYALAVWASTVALSLLVGIVAMNRRELSYATAG